MLGSVRGGGRALRPAAGLDRDAREFNATADLWVAPADKLNELATVPFAIAPSRVAALHPSRTGGVRLYRGSFLDTGDRRLWVVAPARGEPVADPTTQVVDGDLAAATPAAAGGRLGRDLAGTRSGTRRERRRRLDAADATASPSAPGRRADEPRLELRRDGPQRERLPASMGQRRRERPPGDARSRERTKTTVAAAVRRTLAPSSDLGVETSAQREARFRTSTRQGLNRLTQIATLVLVAAALALAAAMGGVVWNRRSRLAALKLSGFSDGEVWRALVLENALVLGIGCSIGAAFGLAGQFMLTRLLADATDFPTSYAPAGWLPRSRRSSA